MTINGGSTYTVMSRIYRSLPDAKQKKEDTNVARMPSMTGSATQKNCRRRKNGLGWIRVENALKTEINDRINATLILMAQGRFAYMDGECDSLVNALCTAVWDPKELTKNVRLDDGTSDIDSLDSFEYTIERQISQLIRYG